MHVTHNLSAYDRKKELLPFTVIGIRVVPRVALILRPFFGTEFFCG